MTEKTIRERIGDDYPARVVVHLSDKKDSIFACGHCGTVDKKVIKVIQVGYANILCPNCLDKLNKEVTVIVEKYLCG